MDLPIVARVVLVVVFAASGIYCLLRCATWSRRAVRAACGSSAEHGRISDLTQVAMSIAMVLMLVTGFAGDRWGVQVTVFAVAGGWFVTRVVAARAWLARTGMANHATMMGGMCWMSYPHGTGMPGMSGSVVPAITIAGYLTLAAGWWGRRSVLGAGAGGVLGATGAATCDAVTSAGMAVALLLAAHL